MEESKWEEFTSLIMIERFPDGCHDDEGPLLHSMVVQLDEGSSQQQQEDQVVGSGTTGTNGSGGGGGSCCCTAIISPNHRSFVLEEEEQQQQPHLSYQCRKPLWWTRLSGKPTKRQRQAIQSLKSYFDLPRPSYGQMVDWEHIFPQPPLLSPPPPQQQQLLQRPTSLESNHPQMIETTTNVMKVTSSNQIDIWVELGFGTGDNLLCLAQMYHGTNQRFVGAEIHGPGLGRIYSILQESMQNQCYYSDYILYKDPSIAECSLVHQEDMGSNYLNEYITPTATTTSFSTTTLIPHQVQYYSNLRIFSGDGIKLLQRCPSGSLATVLVTFPDPFVRFSDGRIIQPSTVREIRRVLRCPGGRLFVATDHEGFHGWTHNVIQAVNNEAAQQQQQQQQQQHQQQQGDVNPSVSYSNVTGTATAIILSRFELIQPCPDRKGWLPVVSKYEQKGYDEGRVVNWLSCWELRTILRCD